MYLSSPCVCVSGDGDCLHREVCVRERESVCVCMRERESVCVCVCVCVFCERE